MRKALITLALVGVASPATAAANVSCGNGNPSQPLQLSAATPHYGTATGFYTVPSGAPTGLVVFAHGFGNSPTLWFAAMQKISSETGAITIAMYNPGETVVPANPPTQPYETTQGYFVKQGAEAGISAAQLFDGSCPALAGKTFVDYGVSMGGNTSGLIAAAGAKRGDGSPLFDYWFDVEGVTNVLETYLEAEAAGAATGSSYVNSAWQAIQQEAGGQTPAQDPQAYEDLMIVNKGAAIKAAGIKGVVIVHGVADGLVPHDQSREMETALTAAGVATDFYAAATAQPGTPTGTTLDSYIPAAHNSPFAGHGSEAWLDHTVTGTALNLLARTLNRQIPAPACHRDFVVDGAAGSLANADQSPLIAPDPATAPDPACT